MLVATIGGPVYSLQLRQLLMASGGSYQGQAITETEEMKMKMKKHRRQQAVRAIEAAKIRKTGESDQVPMARMSKLLALPSIVDIKMEAEALRLVMEDPKEDQNQGAQENQEEEHQEAKVE